MKNDLPVISESPEPWLVDALIQAGRISSSSDVAHVICTSDRVFSARVMHLAVTLVAGDTCFVVVKKCPPCGRMHGREVTFYRDIAPRSPPDLLAPCLYASFDAQAEDFLLVLGDLTPTHHPLTESSTTIPSEEDAHAVVEALSLFHAHWWEHPDLSTTTFMGKQSDEALLHQAVLQKDNALSPFRSAIEERLGTDVLAAYLLTRDIFARKRCARLADGKKLTLIHGDAHAGNFVKARKGHSLPIIIDWPNWATGLATDDLVTFVSGWPVEYQRERFGRLATLQISHLPRSEQTFLGDVRLSAERAFMLAIWNLATGTPEEWAWHLAERTYWFLGELTEDHGDPVASVT